MKHIRVIILFSSLFAIFFSVPIASAHRPDEGNPDGLTQIPDPSTSYAYYREFNGSEDLHVYTVDAEAGQFFHAGINIPQLAGLEDYGVTLALLGPGLPELDPEQFPFMLSKEDAHDDGHDHEHEDGEDHKHDIYDDVHTHEDGQEHLHLDGSLPADLDLSGLGGIIAESQVSEDFYEPFTQTSYWGRQVIELDLLESGRYYLLVWNPQREAGKYVLDTGREEVFGPADILRFPIWWLETRAYFEQTPYLIGAGLFAISGMVLVVAYRSRER